MRDVPVWDLATRAFHWLLVAAVVTCLFTGEDRGLIFAVHAYVGYLVLLLLGFRLGWGFLGSRHSLFADFIYSPAASLRYTGSLLRLKPDHHVGHNPLGGWMVVVMLIVLAVVTATGVIMVAEGSKALEDLHKVLGNVIQILVLIHIAGVIADRILTGEKLVRAMVIGAKQLPEDEAGREPPLVGPARALVLAAVVLVAGAVLYVQVDYPAKITAFETVRGHRGSHD